MAEGESHYKVSIDGQGSIEVRGTPDFVRKHTDYLNDVLGAAMKAQMEAEVAKGRNANDVMAEMLAKLDDAAVEAGLSPVSSSM